MLTSKEIENREERELAPYAMKSKDSGGRKHPEEEHQYRSIYQRIHTRDSHKGSIHTRGHTLISDLISSNRLLTSSSLDIFDFIIVTRRLMEE